MGASVAVLSQRSERPTQWRGLLENAHGCREEAWRATGQAAGDPAQVGMAPGQNEVTSRPGRAQKGEMSFFGSWGWGDIIRHWDVL